MEQKLSELAITCLKKTLIEIDEYAKAKQAQRAEPWQQTLIDKVERSIKQYKIIMEGNHGG